MFLSIEYLCIFLCQPIEISFFIFRYIPIHVWVILLTWQRNNSRFTICFVCDRWRFLIQSLEDLDESLRWVSIHCKTFYSAVSAKRIEKVLLDHSKKVQGENNFSCTKTQLSQTYPVHLSTLLEHVIKLFKHVIFLGNWELGCTWSRGLRRRFSPNSSSKIRW